MSHIFISYSRKDKRVVQQYVERLRMKDFIVWQDVSNISAGEIWHQALLDAIEKAEAVVVFWSFAASQSKYVNQEIDHALNNGKLVIPVWLEQVVPLREGLSESNALISSGFSMNAVQKLVAALLKIAPRIQRQLLGFKFNVPMNMQEGTGNQQEIIGGEEYRVLLLVQSAYSQACLIARANTIISKSTRIQLMIQNTGVVNYLIVRDAFDAVLKEDAEYPDETQPLVGLYITGSINPLKDTEYWIDNANVAHYSDMIDTANRAIQTLSSHAEKQPVFQIFQKTLVDISFLLGVQLDRWLPLQLYKWDGSRYVRILGIPPRVPN